MPETPEAIRALADTMVTRFTPPSFVPGCQVKSIADADEYTTDNGWIEAIVGGDNQQRIRYYGTPQGVAVDDYVDVEYFPAYKLYRVFGSTLGGTAVTGGVRVDKVWESDFGAAAMQTDAAGNVTINGTRTLTIPTDLIHAGDPDNKIGFIDDVQTFTVGGLSMLTLTEAAQDLITLGPGSGDVDINFNGDMFLRGSDGKLGISTVTPQAFLDIASFGVLAYFGDGSSLAQIVFDGSASSVRDMIFRSGGVNRWIFRVNSVAEGGSDAGSDFVIQPRTDAGGPKADAFYLKRSNGFASIGHGAIPLTRLDVAAGAISGLEMTAPAAGAANTYRLFARDDGAGKTEFCIRLATGLIQVIAPLEFGGISVIENAAATTITTGGVPVQITVFDTNEPSNGATPDHTNDHVTINKAGTYLIACSITAISVAGAAAKFHFDIQKNNGATVVGQIHGDRNFAGGGGDAGSVTMSGLAVLSSGDTIEAWVINETGTQNIVVEDFNLAITMIGVNA